MKLKSFVLGMSFVLVLASLAGAAETQVQTRKVDNFIFLVDTSGSMMTEKYAPAGELKIKDSVEVMRAVNARIPELGYQAGLYTAAPAREIAPMGFFNVSSYETAINNVPVHLGNRPTPLGAGLKAFEPVMHELQGRTAIIVISDGRENAGENSLEVVEEFKNEFDVCFHVISYADVARGNQALLDKIASQDCSARVTAEEMKDPAVVENFVRKVFFGTECVVTDGDDDGDGVPNSIDKCPDTPRDLAVDEFGCPIPVKRLLKINFGFDKAEVKPEYDAELAGFAEFMEQYPGVLVNIEGHTDSIGSEKYNQKLSERRAASVRAYLIKHFNMDASLLQAVGYGEDRPIADNKTDAGRADNRRIEAVLDGIYEKR